MQKYGIHHTSRVFTIYSNTRMRMVRMVHTVIHLFIFHFCFLLLNCVCGWCVCPWILVVYNPCLDSSVCCAFGEKKSKEMNISECNSKCIYPKCYSKVAANVLAQLYHPRFDRKCYSMDATSVFAQLYEPRLDLYINQA